MAITEHGSEDLRTILSQREPETMEALISKMESVQQAVGQAGLAHTEPFQRGYLHLTKRVDERIIALPEPGKEPFFRERESLQKTALIFARYWFDPLLDQATGKEPVRAWQPLLQDERARNASHGIQFLLGMSAHIIYDLPQALAESNPKREYYDDFLAVDDLIRETAEELSHDFILIRHNKRKKVVTNLTTAAVKRWRAQSWKDFETLRAYRERGDDVGQAQLIAQLERRTVRTSNTLLSLGDTAIRAFDKTPSLYFM
jgi:hypothetical protein